MPHLFPTLRRSAALLLCLLASICTVRAQFATPIQNGSISAAEYSNNNNGTWYLTWDNDNVYFAKTGGAAAEPVYIYLDVDPTLPTNGGTAASGSVSGTTDFGTTPTLPFRADVRIYWQSSTNYIEYRLRDGSGGWGPAQTGSANINLGVSSGTSREMRLLWSAVTGAGRPAGFNWLGYEASQATPYFVYDQTPGFNNVTGSTPVFTYYYTVSSTANGSATKPFDQLSYTVPPTSVSGFGSIGVFDFNLNSPGSTVTRSSGGGQSWTIDHTLALGAGTLDFGSSTTPVSTANLLLNAGATLRLSNNVGGDLNVSGDFTSNGTFQPNSRAVRFTGSGAQLIGGSSLAFDFLTVAGSGAKTLLNDASSSQNLIFQNGILSTGPNTFTLLGSATLTETASDYLLGRLQMTRTVAAINTAYTFPDGLIITPRTGGTVPGLTTALRTTGSFVTGQLSSQSILRRYLLTAPTSTGLFYDLVFPYRDAEQNGIANNDLTLFRSSTGDVGPWQPLFYTSRSNGARTVTRTGLADLGTITLGSAAAPLPVGLLRFAAEPTGPTAVTLSWTTAQELGNAGFTVERSLDGRRFLDLGRVAGQGNSTTQHSYQYLDAAAPRAQLLYYRLRQTDFDGTTAYSPVATVRPAAAGLLLAPNPTADWLSISTTARAETKGVIQDLRGRPVLRLLLSGGQARVSVSRLPAGVYVVRVGTESARFLKQ